LIPLIRLTDNGQSTKTETAIMHIPEATVGTGDNGKPVEGDTSGMKFVQDAPILSALIRSDNGTTAHVAGTGMGRECELVCSDGVIRIVNDGEAVQVRRRDAASGALDRVPVEQMAPRSGTVHKIRDLVEAIKTGQPGRSNL